MRSLAYKQKQNLSIKSIQQQIQQSLHDNKMPPSVKSLGKTVNFKTSKENIDVKVSQNHAQRPQYSVYTIPILQSEPTIADHLSRPKGRGLLQDVRPPRCRQQISLKKTTKLFKKCSGENQNSCANRKQKDRREFKAQKGMEVQCLPRFPRKSGGGLIENREEIQRLERQCVLMGKSRIPESVSVSSKVGSSINFSASGHNSQTSSAEFQRLTEKRESFKKKMKLKLSRRHIYHTLKQKSEAFHKVKSKNNNYSLQLHHTGEAQMLQSHQSYLSEENSLNRLHFSLKKKHFKSLPLNQLKSSAFFIKIEEPLRVQSKQAHLQAPKRSRQEAFLLPNQLKLPNNPKFNTFGNFNLRRDTREQRSIFELKSQIEHLRRTRGLVGERGVKAGVKTETVNIFRWLTPWQGQHVERQLEQKYESQL